MLRLLILLQTLVDPLQLRHAANAQTRPHAAQIRDWRQVSTAELTGVSQGTRVHIRQIAGVDEARIAAWRKLVRSRCCAEFRMAVSPGQAAPVMIYCVRTCGQGMPWIASRP